MKAAQINKYGGIEIIEINSNAPKPSVKDGQLLVEVHSAAINPIDWKVREGYLQKMMPLSFPATLGGDFSGVVVEAGKNVSNFKVGDEVYGQAILLNGGSGSLAEYVAANAVNTGRKPEKINYAEAAALPLAGVSAMQALEEHINLKGGQKILIHGGAGGIGSFAIQFAKHLGAYVATTVSADDKEFAKKLGADKVIDYGNESFENLLHDYDVVFDTVGGETYTRSFKVIKKGGIIVSMLEQPNEELSKQYGSKALRQGTQVNTQRLTRLAEIVDSGAIKIHIDREFPLERASEAFTCLEKEHPRGKVVVRVK